jgi:TolA-binding protein
MQEQIKVPKYFLDLINQIFEIEKKLSNIQETNSIQRNLNKLKDLLENEISTQSGEQGGFIYHNPIGEVYNETRTDCEASIAGSSTDNLFITEVIKPIIRYKKGGLNIIVQKAVVVAESKTVKS